MDPQLVCGISSQAEALHADDDELDISSRNQLRRLDLRWSGNSAVLRAWSEPEGLPSLPHLETVDIIVPDGTVVREIFLSPPPPPTRRNFNINLEIPHRE